MDILDEVKGEVEGDNIPIFRKKLLHLLAYCNQNLRRLTARSIFIRKKQLEPIFLKLLDQIIDGGLLMLYSRNQVVELLLGDLELRANHFLEAGCRN